MASQYIDIVVYRTSVCCALTKSYQQGRTDISEYCMQDRAPNKAVVAESVVALVTRKGNPKNVTDWNDLTR